MSLRHEWKFSFTGQDLYSAADEKAVYHETRLEFWTAEFVMAEEKVKSTGVDVREYPVTGGNRLELVIDPTLQARYEECHKKLQMHEMMADEFDRYARAFELNVDALFDLDADDIRYFGL